MGMVLILVTWPETFVQTFVPRPCGVYMKFELNRLCGFRGLEMLTADIHTTKIFVHTLECLKTTWFSFGATENTICHTWMPIFLKIILTVVSVHYRKQFCRAKTAWYERMEHFQYINEFRLEKIVYKLRTALPYILNFALISIETRILW